MLDPLSAARSIREQYQRYLRTTFALQSKDWNDEFSRALQDDIELTKGPYLEISPPYLHGRSPRELIAEGLFSPLMAGIEPAMPLDRPLYRHQELAVEKAVRHRRNLVIATGTGSGKTECFLLSILNGLLRELEAGTLAQPGVRALLLYPMNALANDQVKRLRHLLARIPQVTFGRYVGETKNTEKEAQTEFRQRYPNEPRVSNELLSRERIQAEPPHILLTNFAMLEYLLLRPSDSSLFDGATGKHWRYLVLDEAHVYDGAKGTEIAMLLRRVRERVNGSQRGRLQCFATSATLGRGEKDYPRITHFASKLFDEGFEWSPQPARQDVVWAQRAPLDLAPTGWSLSPEARATMLLGLQSGSTSIDLARVVQEVGGILPSADPASTDPEAFVAEVLSRDDALRRCWRVMTKGARSLKEAAHEVFPGPGGEKALVDLVALGARARPSPEAAPLLPARYHFFARSLDGAFVCLHPDHPASERRLRLVRHEECPACRPKHVAAMFEFGTCKKCGAAYLLGSLGGGDALGLPRTAEATSFFLVGGAVSGEDDEDESLLGAAGKHVALYLCASCRHLDSEPGQCSCGTTASRVRVTQAEPAEKADVLRCCVACAGRTNGEIVLRFVTGTDAPVSVLATSLYQELPAAGDGAQKVGEGRKLLCFSDSRQDAAFFAPYLERTYERALRRRLIVEALQASPGERLRLRDVVARLVPRGLDTLVLDPSDSPTAHRRIVSTWLMQEVLASDRRQSIEGTGLAAIGVALPHTFTAPAPLLALGLTEPEVRSLLQLLLGTIWGGGAVTFPPDVDVRDEAFEPRNREIACRLAGSGPGVMSWMPGAGANRRLDLLRKVLDVKASAADPATTLSEIWQYLTQAGGAWSKTLVAQGGAQGVLWRVAYETLEFTVAGADGLVPLLCSSCRQVQWHSVGGRCSTYRCAGRVSPVADSAAIPGAHYRTLYERLRPAGLVAQEHTAQWTPDQASRIQDAFVRGDVNVLSCSTTFELGVDVGEVEAVLLRNVPPSPANYLQRAGRAGRRTTSAAFIVTFAQRRNHDTFHFSEPQQLIDGVISPPDIYLDNANIVRRHVHSMAFAAFERMSTTPHATVADFFCSATGAGSASVEFVSWLRGRPVELGESVARVVPSSLGESLGTSDWGWVDALEMSSDENPTWGWLARAGLEVTSELSDLDSAIDEAAGAKNFGRAKALQDQQRTTAGQRLIAFLASRNVLPKYGFPVDVVLLDLGRSGDRDAPNIELDRDLRLAIVEFAPEAQVVAAKALWVSRGLGTRPNRAWPSRHWAVCGECGGYRQAVVELAPDCPSCGSFEKSAQGTFVIPVFGFLGGRSDRGPGEARPGNKNFAELHFSDYQAGDPSQLALAPDLARVEVRFSRQGRITVLNRGSQGRGFQVCEWCGFARVPVAASKAKAPKTHKDPRRPRDCSGSLRWLQLGHDFLTDVVELRLGVPKLDEAEGRSVLYALLAGTKAAGVREGEMDGTMFHYGRGLPPALVLLDDVPGGAGHALRVSESLRAVFEEARRVVSQCDCGIETSCYGCLRHYRNQRWHDVLSRRAAIRVLDAMLGSATETQG